MKIGVLTLPFNNNYGGILQSYALQSVLKKRGHDVKFIKRLPNKYTDSLISKLKWFLGYSYWRDLKDNKQVKEFSMFEKQFMCATDSIRMDKEFNKLDKENLELLLVGSDQVWRANYTRDRLTNYFFLISPSIKELKKASYAASFGTDVWEANSSKEDVKKLLDTFSGISVRETSGVEICKEVFDVSAEHILDPTFLIDVEEYLSLPYERQGGNNDVLVYLLDPTAEKFQITSEVVASNRGNAVYTGFGPEGKKKYIEIGEWVRYFSTCKYVVTDSFHGCVFALIFKKPFVVIGNSGRGLTRFDSLLSSFQLSDRLIKGHNDLQNIQIDYVVNEALIDQVIAESRINSDLFLKKLGV